MKIRVTRSNIASIQEALNTVQGWAVERCATPERVLKSAEKAETTLTLYGVPLKERRGLKITLNCSEELPRSYKHAAKATFVVMVRGSEEWFIEEIYRTYNHFKISDSYTTFHNLEGVSHYILETVRTSV